MTAEEWRIAGFTLQMAAMSTMLILPPGLLLGWLLARRNWPGKSLIETLVTLARDMHMEIIAEGVETFEQVQHLRERGIRKAQGYVFAPPLPGTSFIQLLQANTPGAEPAATPAVRIA